MMIEGARRTLPEHEITSCEPTLRYGERPPLTPTPKGDLIVRPTRSRGARELVPHPLPPASLAPDCSTHPQAVPNAFSPDASTRPRCRGRQRCRPCHSLRHDLRSPERTTLPPEEGRGCSRGEAQGGCQATEEHKGVHQGDGTAAGSPFRRAIHVFGRGLVGY